MDVPAAQCAVRSMPSGGLVWLVDMEVKIYGGLCVSGKGDAASCFVVRIFSIRSVLTVLGIDMR